MENTRSQPNTDNKSIRQYFTPFTVDLYNITDKEKIAAYFDKVNKLPKSLRNILTNFATAEFIEDSIGQKFNLSIDQKRETSRIIRDLIFGIHSLDDLSTTITGKLGVDSNTANKIVDLILSDLFKSSINELRSARPKSNLPPPNLPRRPMPERAVPKPEPEVNKNNLVDLRELGE